MKFLLYDSCVQNFEIWQKFAFLAMYRQILDIGRTFGQILIRDKILSIMIHYQADPLSQYGPPIMTTSTYPPLRGGSVDVDKIFSLMSLLLDKGALSRHFEHAGARVWFLEAKRETGAK